MDVTSETKAERRWLAKRALKMVRPYGLVGAAVLTLAAIVCLAAGLFAFEVGTELAQTSDCGVLGCGHPQSANLPVSGIVAGSGILLVLGGLFLVAMATLLVARLVRLNLVRRQLSPALARAKDHFAAGEIERSTFEQHRDVLMALMSGQTAGQRLWHAGGVLVAVGFYTLPLAILLAVGGFYYHGRPEVAPTGPFFAVFGGGFAIAVAIVVAALLVAGFPLRSLGRAKTGSDLAQAQRSEDDLLHEVNTYNRRRKETGASGKARSSTT